MFYRIALFATLAITAIGCGSADAAKNETAGATPTADATAGTEAAMSKCVDCGTEVSKADAVVKDGKTHCKACADAHA